MGDEKNQLIVIDTPGYDDMDKKNSKEYKKDLQNKLAAMERLDLVLILLGKQSLGVLNYYLVQYKDRTVGLFYLDLSLHL